MTTNASTRIPSPATMFRMRTVLTETTGQRHAKKLRARWRNRLLEVGRSCNRTRPNLAKSPSDRERCVLFELPAELRNRIFEYAFGGKIVKVKLEHDYSPPYTWKEVRNMTEHPLDKLTVSKQYYQEAVAVYYKHTTFSLSSYIDNVRFISRSDHNLLKHIRSVGVDVRLGRASTSTDVNNWVN